MSKERELLKTILAYMCAEYLVITEFEMITQIEDTVKEIQELLAQPEQGPSVKLPDSEDEAVMMNLLSDNWLRHHAPHRLNQPEQEPVGIVITIGGYPDDSEHTVKLTCRHKDLKDGDLLYTAPPKREPLTPKLISLGNNCHESFIKGIRFAEEMHGIGGGE